MARFLCAGDLHLGAGADLGRTPQERLDEQEAVLDRIVDVANELEVDALLWAGDAFEGPIPTPEQYAAFERPLRRLQSPLVGIVGNGRHDAAMRSVNALEIALAGTVELDVATRPDVTVAGAAYRPNGAALVCRLPWVAPGNLVALHDGGSDRDEINRRIAKGLIDVARGLYADARGSIAEGSAPIPIILLAHWSVGGAETPTGIPADLFREPVLNLDELASIGFDAVVLGHIHKAQTLTSPTDGSSGPVFYVGSPMPLNFGEATIPHGVTLLDVEPGRSAGVYNVPIESRPLVTLTLDATRSDSERLALEPPLAPGGEARSDPFDCLARHLRWKDGDPSPIEGAIVKVVARGTAAQARRWDLANLRGNLTGNELGAHKVWAIQTEIERADVVRTAVDETIDDEEAFRLWLNAAGVTVSPVDGGPLPDYESELVDLHRNYLQEAHHA